MLHLNTFGYMLFCKHNLESFILQSCGDFSSSLNEVDRLIILRTKELMNLSDIKLV